MANKKIDRDRVVELFKKQTQEDKGYIITEIIKSLSENEELNELKSKVINLECELMYYKENSPQIVKKFIRDLMKEKSTKDEDKNK